MGTPIHKVLSWPSKHSRPNRIFTWWLFFSWESLSLKEQSNPYCTVLHSLRGICLTVLHWQLSLEYTSRNEGNRCESSGLVLCLFVVFFFLTCTGHGIAPKPPSSTLVDHNSQLKSLTKPIWSNSGQSCWSNSPNSSNSCVYEVFCQNLMHECQPGGETGSYQGLESVQPFGKGKEVWSSKGQLQPHCKQRKGKGRAIKLHTLTGLQQGGMLPLSTCQGRKQPPTLHPAELLYFNMWVGMSFFSLTGSM